jgi:hypothetical protein
MALIWAVFMLTMTTMAGNFNGKMMMSSGPSALPNVNARHDLLSNAANVLDTKDDPKDDVAVDEPTAAVPALDDAIACASLDPALTAPCPAGPAIACPLDTTLSAAEQRAIRIPSQNKNKKFKGKSDDEMKKIRSSNILFMSHSTTKETTIDQMYSYLTQDEDLADLADWRRLIVLTSGPRNTKNGMKGLLCIAVPLRIDDKALDASTTVNARKPKHLRQWLNYESEPSTINMFFKCVFAYAVNLGVCYSAHDFKDSKGDRIAFFVFIPPVTVKKHLLTSCNCYILFPLLLKMVAFKHI